MPSKTRIILVGILILLGGALFCYCAVFYPTEDAAQAEDASTTIAAAQTAPAQAASACDAGQDKSDPPKKTSSQSRSRAPRAAT